MPDLDLVGLSDVHIYFTRKYLCSASNLLNLTSVYLLSDLHTPDRTGGLYIGTYH